MDNLTHTLAGALLGAALPADRAATGSPGMSLKARAALCAVVTNLPDLDYLAAFGAAPFEMLNLHRGITHSFVLAPVWGAAIGGLLYFALRGRFRALELMVLSVAALLLHATLDLLTAYGTQVFAPLSAQPFALPVLFIIDPWLWLVLGTGAVLAWRRDSEAIARGGLLALTGYVALCGALMLRAEQVAAREAEQRMFPRSVLVLPQPLAPTHWKVVVVDGDVYHTSYLDLAGFREQPPIGDEAPLLVRVWRSYQPADHLEWTHRHRFGADPLMRGFARFAWGREELAEFRRFALLPQMYALSNEGGDAGCGWFTDLRFEHKAMPNPFVAGICHGPVEGRLSKSAGWRLAEAAAPPARSR